MRDPPPLGRDNIQLAFLRRASVVGVELPKSFADLRGQDALPDSPTVARPTPAEFRTHKGAAQIVDEQGEI